MKGEKKKNDDNNHNYDNEDIGDKEDEFNEANSITSRVYEPSCVNYNSIHFLLFYMSFLFCYIY